MNVIKDDAAITPLHLAAQNGHLNICEYISEMIEDKNPKISIVEITPLHEGAFYQLFVWLGSATTFESFSGNIDVPLSKYQMDSGENWQKLELFGFKVKIFNSKNY